MLIKKNGDWCEKGDDTELKLEALHIQENLLPQLKDSDHFQIAISNIVHNKKYEKIADANQFSRISSDI